MLKRSKRLVAAIVASLSIFGTFPGMPTLFPPAVAEAETTGPLFMENLGWGLPLRVYETYSGPEWMTIKRHFPGIMFKGKFEEKYLPIIGALEGYSVDQSKFTEKDGPDIITKLRVRRADNRVVSFVESRACFTDGKHGRYGIFGINYDTATGSELAFDDVFVNREQLANEIAPRMSALYPGRFPADSLGSGEYDAFCAKVKRVMANNEFSWSLDPFGATFYFNPGSLTPESDDNIYTITFCFAYTPYHFQPKYRSCPESFCMDVEPRLPTMLCFDESSDKLTEVTVNTQGVVIRRNGEEFVDPGELEGIRPVFVMTGDRRKYLYADCETAAMNPKHELRVYDLNGDNIFRVDCDSKLTFLATEPSEEIQRAWFVMSDPDSFLMTRVDSQFLDDYVLCHVGKDGAPVIMGPARDVIK